MSTELQAGRNRNRAAQMKGCINQDSVLTDLYLPRKCDYTDRLIAPKDKSSVQISICDVNQNGTINQKSSHILTISGYVRWTGQSDVAIEKIMKQKNIK